MKKLFVDAEYCGSLDLPKELKGKRVGIVWSSQYAGQAERVKGIKGGAVLGCDVQNAVGIKNFVDCYFFVGDGRFHALEICKKTGKDVYVLDGERVGRREVEDYLKRLKGKYIRFLNARKTGVLISLKPGQKNVKLGLELCKKYNSYAFLGDTFDTGSLEDFRDIDIFINTACARIEGNKIIHHQELP